MDVQKALRELYAEKKRLDSIINTLESKLKARVHQMPQKTSRRGRRSMSSAERQEVSRRMTNYWAAKRADKNPRNDVEEQPQLEAKRASA